MIVVIAHLYSLNVNEGNKMLMITNYYQSISEEVPHQA